MFVVALQSLVSFLQVQLALQQQLQQELQQQLKLKQEHQQLQQQLKVQQALTQQMDLQQLAKQHNKDQLTLPVSAVSAAHCSTTAARWTHPVPTLLTLWRNCRRCPRSDISQSSNCYEYRRRVFITVSCCCRFRCRRT